MQAINIFTIFCFIMLPSQWNHIQQCHIFHHTYQRINCRGNRSRPYSTTTASLHHCHDWCVKACKTDFYFNLKRIFKLGLRLECVFVLHCHSSAQKRNESTEYRIWTLIFDIFRQNFTGEFYIGYFWKWLTTSLSGLWVTSTVLAGAGVIVQQQ